ncbi:M48 family metallopeptidase [Candidatus Berkiella cookevillensis]|uniref:M48 family metallopeptidase n=1 Tax=Candidatus Berkiella cookevillensis TaxID=437022 RepID=A0A0Q9YB25_9GAMM|nr:M48 family metallopeptidase [Candidatus Berkiella cookevillensis]MCS5709032.1 M48 family metallopeptidase [Candidatus Berkiella cookevillensis]
MSTTPIKARFFDGQSIKPQEANISLKADIIQISLEDKIYTWPCKELLIIERPHEGKASVIGCKNMMGARIIIEDDAFYRTLEPLVPESNIKLSHVHHPWRKISILLVVLAAIFAFVLFGIPYFAPSIARIIPHKWDNALGAFFIAETLKGSNYCTQEEGSQALQKIIHRLTEHQSLEQAFNIKVVDIHDINAFAAPGYHIIILKGLIDTANTPEEVAGVLAHEMSHSIQHHPTAGLISQLGIKIIVASAFSSFPDLGLSLVNFSYSRQKEYEADEIGVRILNEANLDASGLAKFFNTIIQHAGDSDEFSVYLSTHPSSKDRIARVKALNKIKNAEPLLTKKEWQDLRNICKKKEKIE